MRKRRVVILGAGFAGIACAKALAKFDGEVVVVDKTNHHLFQPLLYQVATAGLSGSDIAQPVRTILRGQRNVNVHMAAVESIDLVRQVIKLDWEKQELEYDYLVIALGVETNYFGHDEWAKYALGLKTLSDAKAIRDRLLRAFERAENLTNDPAERQRQLTAVVIGGGPTGVEMAGAFAELARRALRPEFKLANLAETRVVLVDAGERLLSTFAPELSARAKSDLERMGVTVKLGTMVQDIGEGFVIASGERIDAATIVWAAGVTAPATTRPLAEQGVTLDRTGRIVPRADCAVTGFANVFAAGDIANMTDAKGVVVPGVAQGGMQMGKYVGRVIMADVAGKRSKIRGFVYWDKGTMATIGRLSAVADVGGLRVGGFIAWVLWLVIHLLFLVDLRSKMTVLLKWIAAFVFYRPTGRVIGEGK